MTLLIQTRVFRKQCRTFVPRTFVGRMHRAEVTLHQYYQLAQHNVLSLSSFSLVLLRCLVRIQEEFIEIRFLVRLCNGN